MKSISSHFSIRTAYKWLHQIHIHSLPHGVSFISLPLWAVKLWSWEAAAARVLDALLVLFSCCCHRFMAAQCNWTDWVNVLLCNSLSLWPCHWHNKSQVAQPGCHLCPLSLLCEWVVVSSLLLNSKKINESESGLVNGAVVSKQEGPLPSYAVLCPWHDAL